MRQRATLTAAELDCLYRGKLHGQTAAEIAHVLQCSQRVCVNDSSAPSAAACTPCIHAHPDHGHVESQLRVFLVLLVALLNSAHRICLSQMGQHVRKNRTIAGVRGRCLLRLY
jgi:hypothetical protein